MMQWMRNKGTKRTKDENKIFSVYSLKINILYSKAGHKEFFWNEKLRCNCVCVYEMDLMDYKFPA